MLELFATETAAYRSDSRWPALAEQAGVVVDLVSDKAIASLSETATPQGVVAVCRLLDRPLVDILAKRPRLVAALVEPNDPGNAGTIVRAADAAGADAVIFVGGVDPYNGKAVRASAGSLFHLDLVIEPDIDVVLAASAAAGLASLATTGSAARDLDQLADDGTLARPTLWLFGSEAHGLPERVIGAADEAVRLPIYGAAESLNLGVAAGICLYASAREQRRPPTHK